MNRRRAGWAMLPLAAVLLVACGGGGGGAAPGPVPPGALVAPGTWTVIGSSTAAGVGASAGHGWVDLLRSDYAGRGVSVVNLAASGSVSYQGLPGGSPPPPGRPPPDPAHNIDAALSQGPKLVIASYPSNDTAAGYSAEETVGNLLTIRASAADRGVPSVVTSTQPSRPVPTAAHAATVAQIDGRLAAEFGPCFVEIRSVLATPQNTLDPRYDSGDGQHLNDAGHLVVFQRVKAVLDGRQCVRVTP